MKIDLTRLELDKAGTEPAVLNATKQKHLSSAQVQASGVFTEIGSNALDDLHAYSKKSRTAAQRIADAEFSDERINRNYMAVMANTMSGKDFKELVEKGYAPGQMQPKDAVNSLDRMKIRLSQAGVEVEGYTDTVSAGEAEQITGSRAMANRITGDHSGEYKSSSEDLSVDVSIPDGMKMIPREEEIKAALEEADLPATEENLKDIRKAFETAFEIKNFGEPAMLFMVENEMEPTIRNVYEAGFSAGSNAGSSRGGYFYEGTGYFSAAAEGFDGADNSELSRQIDEVIESAGLKAEEGSRKDAETLIDKGIPLTKENLLLFSDLKKIDIRPGLREMTSAIERGKRPMDAYLVRDYNNIRSERQLKEAGLVMTHEANRRLITDDRQIDTSYLENEVEELKKNEKALWDLLDETLQTAGEIKEAPAELIGNYEFMKIPLKRDELSLSDIRSEGALLKNRYESMQATYEAVGTEVRPDLGDSIKKAFNNVDSILDETGYEINEENRRAVRILGYSSMEISAENIDRIKAADEKINTMVSLLTPKNVLRLIRDNINPLTVSVDELNEKLNSYDEADGEQTEQFAKYLVNMRDRGEITQEEAASYVGIYRLIDKLNRTDGAAIGSLINQNAELSARNLLTALRSARCGHMDYILDSEFGGMQTVEDETVLKIDTQISTAFSEEYYEEETQKFVDAAKAEERLYKLLNDAGMETSADNINAAAGLLDAKGGFFKSLLTEENEKDRSRERLKKAVKKTFETMDDPDAFADAYDEMVNEEVIAAFEGERLDIRALQTKTKVTSIQRAFSDSESYQVPVEINGEITSINLQIRHGENRGNVDIYFESDSLGMISAGFTLDDKTTKGIVACGSNRGFAWVEKHREELEKALSLGTREITMEVIRSDGRVSDRPVGARDGGNLDNAVLYRTAKAFIGGFIHEDQQ